MAKRSLILFTTIVVLAALTIAGCVNNISPTSPTSRPLTTVTRAPPLEGTTWVLTSLQTEEGAANILPNTTVTATFNDGNVTGSSGCNRYFARYNLSGQDAVTFTSLGSTVMYCTNPGVMAQETTYVHLLQNTTAYVVSADTLSLLNGRGQVQLIFKALNATA